MRFLFIIPMYISSICAIAYDCDNTVTENHWNTYSESIKSIIPFIDGKSPLITYSYPSGGYYNKLNIFHPLANHLIISSDKRCILIHRPPIIHQSYNDITPACIDTIDFKTIEKLFIDEDGISFFEDMFIKNQYHDCYITESEYYNYNSTLPAFFAMVDENGVVHGATRLAIGQKTPFPEKYIIALFHSLFKSMEMCAHDSENN